MKSTLLNMVLVLGGITLVAAALLGLVYDVTKEPIEAAKSSKTTGALAQVMPAFDNDPSADAQTLEIDGMPIKVYTGRKDGAVAGYAVETMTKNGFSGEIKMMVGFEPDGDIVNIEVLQHNETPGLGSKIADPGNVLLVSFQGNNPENLKMSVRKDGGDIDAITASTISSRAYVDAVERGYKAFQAVALGAEIESAQPEDPYAKLFGEYDNNPGNEAVTVNVDGDDVRIYPVSAAGIIKGYAVESGQDGFEDVVRLLVGFGTNGVINGVAVLEQHETPGFGSQITEAGNVLEQSFIGKSGGEIKFELKADGGDADAISGSTITSRGYLAAVKNAYIAYRSYINQNAGNE